MLDGTLKELQGDLREMTETPGWSHAARTALRKKRGKIRHSLATNKHLSIEEVRTLQDQHKWITELLTDPIGFFLKELESEAQPDPDPED